MGGTIEKIFICAKSPDALQSVPSARVEEGRGIVGDRYHRGEGTFSNGAADRQVTLIEVEEIHRFNDQTGLGFSEGAFRRNLVTKGVRLNDYVGKRFTVGSVTLEGLRTCEPCKHLSRLLSPEVMSAMKHRAGLRARVIEGGSIELGSAVE